MTTSINNRQEFLQHYLDSAKNGGQGAQDVMAMLTQAAKENEQVGAVIEEVLGMPIGSLSPGSSTGEIDLSALWGGDPQLADEEQTKEILNTIREIVTALPQVGTQNGVTTTGAADPVVQARAMFEQAIGDSIENPTLRKLVVDHLTAQVESLLSGGKSTGQALVEKLAELAYRIGQIAAGKGDPGGQIPDDSLAGLVRKSAGELTGQIQEMLQNLDPAKAKDLIKLLSPELGNVLSSANVTDEAVSSALSEAQTKDIIDTLTEFVIQDKGLDAEKDADEIATLRQQIADNLAAHVEKFPADLAYFATGLKSDKTDAIILTALKRLEIETPATESKNIRFSEMNISKKSGLRGLQASVFLMVQLMMLNLTLYSRNRELAVKTKDIKFDLGMGKAENIRKTADKQLDLDLDEIKQQVFDMVVESIGALLDTVGSGLIAVNPVAGLIVKGVGSLGTGLTKGIVDIQYDTAQAYMKHAIEISRSLGEEIAAHKDDAESDFQLILKDMDKAMEMVKALLDMMAQMVQMLNQLEQKAGGMSA